MILKTIDLSGFGEKIRGKVRDCYVVNNKRILITTDRISAFDKILGFIPQKGEVLNMLSVFWFEQTKDIIDNHMISVPDPNVLIAKNATLIPIEMVVRGYITGVTDTSLWGSYEKGERVIYGIAFPDNLKKNQQLEMPVITPTTKAEVGHDERLTKETIMQKNLVDKTLYEQMEEAALLLFKRGTDICNKKGLILVDTKYEFGVYDGQLILIDEVHTPDNSRFWIKETYKERFDKSLEPENFDKEFLRLWFANQGYKGNGAPPQMPEEFVETVSKRYKDVYTMITGKEISMSNESITERIKKNLNQSNL
jgi:phosphoribosylaminoimidazole-succinocarboxamide synthase